MVVLHGLALLGVGYYAVFGFWVDVGGRVKVGRGGEEGRRVGKGEEGCWIGSLKELMMFA